MLRFDKATYLPLLFKFILSERLSNSLWWLDDLLYSEFINIVSILIYNFIEFIMFFFFISFGPLKEYITWHILFKHI